MTVLETDRLTLRLITEDDAPFLLGLLNEPSFLRYIGDRNVRTLDDARAYVANGPAASYAKHGFGLYLVVRTEDGEPLGMCGLIKRDTLPHADLGYAFLPQHWSRGYAAEAAAGVVAHARRDLALGTLLAVISPDNDPSARVLEKLGFRYEQTMPFGDDGHPVKLFVLGM